MLRLRLANATQAGEQDCSAANNLMRLEASAAASLAAVERAVAKAAAYEAADRQSFVVALPLDAQQGESDCSAANNLMRLEASAAASLAAVERAVAKAAAYEAADRQSFVVALPLDAQQGENDCSAASTYLHGRWSEGCREQLQTMEDAQARAAAYEAADRHTPVVSLPLDAQQGEADCSGINLLMHERAAVASVLAVQDAQARAAVYEAADRLQPAVSLPLDAQQGERDCRAINELLHGKQSEGWIEHAHAMERSQAQSAEYEDADHARAVVGLPLDAQQGEADCSGINLLMHERAAVASVLAVQDAQARAAVYEAADRLQPAVSLPLDAQQGERDCRAINELLQGWRSEGWMEHAHAMERAKAHTAAYVAADQARAVVSLPLDAQQGEADCRPVHALLQKRAAPSVTAMERGRARASEYEAADRLQPAVHLALGALEADDYRAAGAALYRRASPSVQAMERGLALAATYEAADAKQPALSLPSDTKTSQQEMIGALDLTALQAEHTDENSDAVDRALARAAMYEAADRLQPTVSLPVAGQQGEADCRAASALQHERAAASVEAMQRGITQSASYTAADRQLMVRLPLESQEGEADLSAASALMQQMWSSGCEAQLQAVERALARAALYEMTDMQTMVVSLPLDAQQGEADCSSVNLLMHEQAATSVQAMQRGVAQSASYTAADRQLMVRLPLESQEGEADLSAASVLMQQMWSVGWEAQLQAVERALGQTALYEEADCAHAVVSLPLDAQQGEADCRAASALQHERAAASVEAMQRGITQSASYTAADRQLMVRLPLESQEGEADLSAASALMQQMWSSGCEAQLQAVERALARAALYEAADSTQPAISLPLDAQQGEPDCVAVNAMQDGRSGGWRAQLQAVERALARAAMYEMADRLQPTVSLPLDAQQGEADCSGCNQLLHERAGDSVQAVERALARAAEYEAADAQTPVISLPLDAQQGEADCGAVHALCLHKRAAPSLRAMQRGLQQAASYEVTELLEGLPPHVGHAHAGREHPLCALSSALWRDLTALGVSLDSAEAMTPYLQNMQRSLLRERERLLLRQGHADQQLLHKLSHHLDTTTYPHPGSYADPTSAAHTTHLAAAFVAHPVLLGAHVDAASTAHAMHLAASIAPGPALQPYAPHAPSLGACAMEGGDPAATTAKTPLAALRSSTASLPQGRGKAMQKKKRKHRRKNSSRVGVHPKAPGEPALRSTQGLIRQVHAS